VDDAAGIGFSLSGTENGRKYQLYRDDTPVSAVLAGTGAAETFTGGPFNVEGTYMARAVQEGAYCEVAMTGSRAITENPLPAAPDISAADVCLNDGDLVFTATGYSGSLTWVSAGGGDVGGANNTSVTFANGAAAGIKTVIAQTSQTYTNAPACYSAEVTQSATVNPLPTIAHVSESGSVDQTLYAAGPLMPIQYITLGATTATIDGTLPANLSATWSNDTLTISGSAPNNPGEQQYYAIGVSALNQHTGCSTTYTLTGVILALPLPPLPVLSATQYLIEGTVWSDVFTLSPSSCTTGTAREGNYYSVENGIVYYSYDCAVKVMAAYCVSPWFPPTSSQVPSRAGLGQLPPLGFLKNGELMYSIYVYLWLSHNRYCAENGGSYPYSAQDGFHQVPVRCARLP
jgi:hypothetical protein